VRLARPSIPGSHRLFELGVLAALLLQYHRSLVWVARTWTEATYESWGFLALLALLLTRRLPVRRPTPSRLHLAGLVFVCLVDLASAPLGVNVLSAALAVLSLHLGLVTFRVYEGRCLLHPQLWLGLLCLPVVHWANVLCGFQAQQLVSRAAAACLGLYGLPVRAEGVLLHLPDAVVAVDSSCSGLKLLYSGVLLGVVLTGGGGRWSRRVLFWGALCGLLLAANVVRVISLAVAQLQLGRPVGEAAHQGIGLVAFAMVCVASLALWRRLRRGEEASCPA
jgi:exosortase/archaeosortase family protein